jgi:hypothetical protein
MQQGRRLERHEVDNKKNWPCMQEDDEHGVSLARNFSNKTLSKYDLAGERLQTVCMMYMEHCMNDLSCCM